MKLAPSAKNVTGDVELATLFIQEHLGENDIVVITANDDARMWFYFEKYGLGRDYFSRVKPFENAFVVVSNSADQTIPFVISERGPDKGFFAMETIIKIKTINSLDIYFNTSQYGGSIKSIWRLEVSSDTLGLIAKLYKIGLEIPARMTR